MPLKMILAAAFMWCLMKLLDLFAPLADPKLDDEDLDL